MPIREATMSDKREDLLATLRGLDGDHTSAVINGDWRWLADVSRQVANVADELTMLQAEKGDDGDDS